MSRNLIDTIGRTPLVRLGLGAERGVEVYAKLEMQNLYAMKDRVARQIITQARSSGELSPGAPIVESSSGTMALGVGLVGTLLGHPVHIVTDPRIDAITRAKLTAMGCVLHVVAAMDEHGWQGARLRELRRLMAELPGAFWPRQYENPQNPAAYRGLAEELRAELGQVGTLVGSVGSGGSLCGSARALRQALPELRVVGVDCVGSVLFGQPDWPQRQQSGLGNSLHPPNLDRKAVDEVHWLNDHEAFAATRDLAAREKIFAGNTSGSVYQVLSHLATVARPGETLVGIMPDRGDRYVGTVFDDEHWERTGLATLPRPGRPRVVPAGTVVRSWSFLRSGPGAPRPCLAFVESNTTGSGMLALRAAQRAGYEAVLLTGAPQRYHGLDATGATVVRCDTNDADALRSALAPLRERQVLAGVTSTSEYYRETATLLAAEAGLSGQDAEAIAVCRDKGRLREVLTRAGLRQPAYRVVSSAAEVPAAVRAAGLPCVVKPVDESGSTRVRRCGTEAEAAAQAALVVAVERNGRQQPAARRALMESCLDGTEFSVETFAVDGRQRVLAIVQKSVTGAPHFVESRHVVPADIAPETARELSACALAAVQAAGLSEGAAHTEVMLTADGPAVIEVNPRLAGGMIPELIRLVAGTDLVAAEVVAASGGTPELPTTFTGHAGIQFVLPAAAGLLDRVTGVDDAAGVDGVDRVVITAEPGSRVRPPVDAYDRIGYVIATGPSAAAVTAALDKAVALITVETRADAG